MQLKTMKTDPSNDQNDQGESKSRPLILFTQVPLFWSDAKPSQTNASEHVKRDPAKPTNSRYGAKQTSAKDDRKRAKEKAKSMHARIFKRGKDKVSKAQDDEMSFKRAPSLSFTMFPFQSAAGTKALKKDNFSTSRHGKQKLDKTSENSSSRTLRGTSKQSQRNSKSSTQQQDRRACPSSQGERSNVSSGFSKAIQCGLKKNTDGYNLSTSSISELEELHSPAQSDGMMSSVSLDLSVNSSFRCEPVTIVQGPTSFGTQAFEGGLAPTMPKRGGSVAPTSSSGAVQKDQGGMAPRVPTRGGSVGPSSPDASQRVQGGLAPSAPIRGGSAAAISSDNGQKVQGGLAPRMPIRGGASIRNSNAPRKKTNDYNLSISSILELEELHVSSLSLDMSMNSSFGFNSSFQATQEPMSIPQGPSSFGTQHVQGGLAPTLPRRGGSVVHGSGALGSVEKVQGALAPKMPTREASIRSLKPENNSFSSITYDTVMIDDLLSNENKATIEEIPTVDSGVRPPRRATVGCMSSVDSAVSDPSFCESFDTFKLPKKSQQSDFSLCSLPGESCDSFKVDKRSPKQQSDSSLSYFMAGESFDSIKCHKASRFSNSPGVDSFKGKASTDVRPPCATLSPNRRQASM